MEYKSEIKKCQNCKNDFTIDSEDFGFYEKIKVSPPTFCFECRLQRRMIRRNERFLYKRICNLCKTNTISMYSSDAKFPVFCPKCWWGDGWDAFGYGREYDFSKSFFKQYQELMNSTPRIALYQKNPVNSPYTNHSDHLKNSYLAFNCGLSENIFYSKWVVNGKDLSDCYVAFDSELSYEVYESKNCSRCFHIYICKGNIDSGFLYNCRNCINCFLSSNLRNKKYVFKNKQLSKEEYEKEIESYVGSFLGYQRAIEFFEKEILPKTIRKYMASGTQKNCSGDYIFGGSKNLRQCFRIYTAEDSSFCVDSANLKDCHDVYESAFNCEQQYDCHACNRLSYSSFCSVCYDSHNLEYCDMCYDSEYLFGCIGLRNKKYCILNKQYTKEDYFLLIDKIKDQMQKVFYVDNKKLIYKYGEFFPAELSPFCYNETVAQEYFPLDKNVAVEKGYKWKDKEKRSYKIEIPTADIPDNIKDVKESMIGKIINCLHNEIRDHKNYHCEDSCTEAFKITEEEMSFYKRMNIPLPRLCPNCRHYVRQKHVNPMKLWHRECMKEGCQNEFETSYSPDRPEVVYCEKCYQQEVY